MPVPEPEQNWPINEESITSNYSYEYEEDCGNTKRNPQSASKKSSNNNNPSSSISSSSHRKSQSGVPLLPNIRK